MSYQVYNYPWSGRLGRIARCCLYCGNDGPSWQISSSSHCCDEQCHEARKNGKQPIPELVKETEMLYDKLVREWCKERNINYEATVQNYYAHLGPQVSETLIENKSDTDYTVYL